MENSNYWQIFVGENKTLNEMLGNNSIAKTRNDRNYSITNEQN